MRRLIIFSDLDGTLLDHRTYSFAAAAEALAALRARDVPLILASSKTAAEIAPLRAELGFTSCPAIVENGAGLLPPGEAGETGAGGDYDRILNVLADIPASLRAAFRGFAEMTAQEVADVTGLSVEAAARARRRRFSEPGLWRGSDAERDAFVAALAKKGIAARMGGRFLTLSLGRSKADQMAAITAGIAADARVMALGDAPNDAEMLTRADIGVVVANPAAPPMPALVPKPGGALYRTVAEGPAGWNAAVLAVLDDPDSFLCDRPDASGAVVPFQ